jgi:hypothetical protein
MGFHIERSDIFFISETIAIAFNPCVTMTNSTLLGISLHMGAIIVQNPTKTTMDGANIVSKRCF